MKLTVHIYKFQKVYQGSLPCSFASALKKTNRTEYNIYCNNITGKVSSKQTGYASRLLLPTTILFIRLLEKK